MRGIAQVRMLRGEPVEELFTEYAQVFDQESDLQEVSNHEGALGFRAFLAGDFAGAAALSEKAARTVSLNASGDLPRAARAAIWAGDLPTAERLVAEFASDWTHGRCAHARLTVLKADLAAMTGRRGEAMTGYATAIPVLRELGLEVDAVLAMLDMTRTLGPTDPAVVPWRDEARATIERMRMPGLNRLLEIASAGSEGSPPSRRPEAPEVPAEATG